MRQALSLTIDQAAGILHENRGLVYDQEAAGTSADPAYLRTTRDSYLQHAVTLDPSTAVQANPRALPQFRHGFGIGEPVARSVLQCGSSQLRHLETEQATPSQQAAAWMQYLDYTARYFRRAERAHPVRERRREALLVAQNRATATVQAEINYYEALGAVRRFIDSDAPAQKTG